MTLSGPVCDMFITAGDAHDDRGEVAAWTLRMTKTSHTVTCNLCTRLQTYTYIHPHTVVWTDGRGSALQPREV